MRVYWPVALTVKIALFCGILGLVGGILLGLSVAPSAASTPSVAPAHSSSQGMR